MRSGWTTCRWGDLATLEYGRALRKNERNGGPYRVFGTNGPIGYHDRYLAPGPGVVIGRKGADREVHRSEGPFFVIDTAFYLKPLDDFDINWAYYQLKTVDINRLDSGGAIPSTSREAFYELPVSVPPRVMQRKIAAVLSAYDQLIENNSRQIEILGHMAETVYREWFVNFRFPGHGEVPLVDSAFGPIPDGWAVRTVADVAGGNGGVVGGPFGSKLGRKDYVDVGVPVVRGTNLNGPLGWDDDEFVFVSNHKFEELRGNAAQPGDIIVTQRGTLGQVGLVPISAPWPQLVVSQSQMRVRVDPGTSAPLFVYQTLRWPSTNRRLVDYAMSSGVPHINLGILREFKLVVPPLPLAEAYDELVGPMRELAENLSAQNANLRSTRDLLLPKLVSGEIDVSELDIETEWLAS